MNASFQPPDPLRVFFATRTGWAAVAVLAILPLAMACGKKASPRPPQPRGPQAAQAVVVRQLGSRVIAFATVPSPRGDRESQEPVLAELVRVSFPPGTVPQDDPDAFRRRGEIVGRAEGDPMNPGTRVRIFDAELGSTADERVGSTLRYAIRVRDRRGRPSPLVVTRDLVLAPEAAAPTNLTGTATAEGIRLSWNGPAESLPEGTEARYNVYRAEEGTELEESPRNSSALTATEFLDSTVRAGETYVYAVRTVVSDGLPFQESVSSATIRVSSEDRFAPAAPIGLVAVQEGSAVRLFWDPGPEPDLDRYRVYRRVDGDEWAKVAEGEVTQPTWVDRRVRPGDRVAYRVTAVDRADPPNEGEPSDAVEILVADDPEARRGDDS